jgi:hypothetical protein
MVTGTKILNNNITHRDRGVLTMENSTITTILISALVSSIPVIIAWLVNRKKNKAEAADILVGSSMKILEKLEERVTGLELELDDMRSENKRLRNGVGRLINQLRQLGYEPAWTLEQMDKE